MSSKAKSVLFLNLTAFSQMGGLEKFNRCFLKALNENDSLNIKHRSYSLYDTVANENYYPKAKYKGFGKNRISFVVNAVREATKHDIVILGHINLAMVGVLVKMISPKTKLILICHGIEVWGSVTGMQRRLLDKVDKILAVSSYTKQKLVDAQHVEPARVEVFHNTIDPYFEVPKTFEKNTQLMNRYGLKTDDFILFTLCRLSSNEKYKGYDEVIMAMPELLKQYPQLKYVIAGKYDAAEKERIDDLIKALGLAENVILTGYVDDKEVISHYQLGDVYIMPSKGEGFGIVFIEAMVCGSRVIAGNKDGSVDALQNGALGSLVDPESKTEIANAIEQYITGNVNWNTVSSEMLQHKVIQSFGFDVYKKRLGGILSAIINN